MTFDHGAYDAGIERSRKFEYPSLLTTTYLDHAGTTLYSRSLIDDVHEDLSSNLYGNPHSESPASWLSTKRVDEARIAVLKFFCADPKVFDVVFTANATAAVKVVVDCFRDQDFWYGYHKDVHSSVVGVREVATKGSKCFASNKDVDEWINTPTSKDSTLRLFAYPAQSNMTGYRPPYAWCRQVRGAQKNTYVLLDAASYLTSGRLNLSDSEAAPDFICLSFYKIFGYPDLGALIIKKSTSNVLTQKRYFGGGTVNMVTVIDDAYYDRKTQKLHEFLEDGTLPFHNIVALKHAISNHNRLFGAPENIAKHTAHLSGWLYNSLKCLRHFNDTPVLELYKDNDATYGDPKSQGPILAFSVLRSNGSYVGKSHFERLAIDCGFQLRTGGVCNPGGIATMLQLKGWELRRNFAEGVRCGDDIDIVAARPTGIIRISLGPMSTMSDAIRFVKFVKRHFVEHSASPALLSRQAPLDRFVPIEGCLETVVNASQSDACLVWHQQWCIVDSDTHQPIGESLKTVQAVIDFESEELVINKNVRLSLWNEPELPEDASFSTQDVSLFDVYESEELNHNLSESIGRSCKLARYRRKNPRESLEALTCVVAGCYSRCSSESMLKLHYKKHAGEFLKEAPFQIDQRAQKKCWITRFADRKSKQISHELSSHKEPASTVLKMQMRFAKASLLVQ